MKKLLLLLLIVPTLANAQIDSILHYVDDSLSFKTTYGLNELITYSGDTVMGKWVYDGDIKYNYVGSELRAMEQTVGDTVFTYGLSSDSIWILQFKLISFAPTILTPILSSSPPSVMIENGIIYIRSNTAVDMITIYDTFNKVVYQNYPDLNSFNISFNHKGMYRIYVQNIANKYTTMMFYN